MPLRTSFSAKPGLHGQLKLARLLEMPERDFEERVRELEGDPLFSRLVESGIVAVEPYSGARLASRRFGGWGLRTSSEGLPDLVDGRGDMARLISGIGEERFQACFLQDEGLPDEKRASLCGITPAEARALREFVDRVYIQAEFENPAADAAPAKTFSSVAGVAVEGEKPVLGFFNREIWKGRYRVDEDRRARMREGLSPREHRRLERFLRQLEFLDKRKSTLYRVLEALLAAQADYFVSGDPGRRRPLTQLALASDLEISPSVLNRLISNKAIQLPWGLEAPIRTLLPSAKSLLRDRLYGLALENPGLTDESLRKEMSRLFGAKLSRRSIAQYRKELGVGGQGKRKPPHTP